MEYLSFMKNAAEETWKIVRLLQREIQPNTLAKPTLFYSDAYVPLPPQSKMILPYLASALPNPSRKRKSI